MASDFNNLFQESFNQIKSTILSSNLDYDEITECLISSANRHFIVVRKTSGVEGNEHIYEDFFLKGKFNLLIIQLGILMLGLL